MKKSYLFASIFIAFLLLSCSSRQENDNNFLEVASESMQTKEFSADLQVDNFTNLASDNEVNLTPTDRLIIRNADIRMQVTSIEKTKKSIREIANKYSALITFENENRDIKNHTVIMNIKCKAEVLDSLVYEILSLAKFVDNKTISSDDVTIEHIDLESRLKTKTRLVERYHEILAKAKNVAEIMEVEKQINLIQTEVESIEARLKFLNRNISLSNISLTFYENIPYEHRKDSLSERIKKALTLGWSNFVSLIVGIIYLWVYILAIIILFLFFRYYSKRRKRKTKTK